MAKRRGALPKTLLCAACKCPLGGATGVVPFHADDTGRRESFCPPCFVYVRAPLEPSRYRQGQYIPIRCRGCGRKSVAIATDHCMQCRTRFTLGDVLPP